MLHRILRRRRERAHRQLMARLARQTVEDFDVHVDVRVWSDGTPRYGVVQRVERDHLAVRLSGGEVIAADPTRTEYL